MDNEKFGKNVIIHESNGNGYMSQKNSETDALEKLHGEFPFMTHINLINICAAVSMGKKLIAKMRKINLTKQSFSTEICNEVRDWVLMATQSSNFNPGKLFSTQKTVPKLDIKLMSKLFENINMELDLLIDECMEILGQHKSQITKYGVHPMITPHKSTIYMKPTIPEINIDRVVAERSSSKNNYYTTKELRRFASLLFVDTTGNKKQLVKNIRNILQPL